MSTDADRHGPVVLASGSPRRKDLLSRLAPTFASYASPVEEAHDTRTPPWRLEPVELPPPFSLAADDDPRLWGWRKGVDVVEQHRGALAEDTLVLAADTVVSAPGKLLGKPTDRDDARAMLSLLRGRDHRVVTGFVLLNGAGETLHVEAVVSTVTMRAFSQDELEAYIATDEPYDKAGAYALQGLGGRLVERVEGCRNNVIGLPLCRVRVALSNAGADLLPYPDGGYCDYCPFMQSGTR